jgi:hypothetical protein
MSAKWVLKSENGRPRATAVNAIGVPYGEGTPLI